jgi:hypothetical protein
MGRRPTEGGVRFRKKPLVIEAMQWTDNWDEVRSFLGSAAYPDATGLSIQTPEGALHVSHYDWIIKGIKGEFYPCRPDIFAETYECVLSDCDG